jgi:hypothetical protein
MSEQLLSPTLCSPNQKVSKTNASGQVLKTHAILIVRASGHGVVGLDYMQRWTRNWRRPEIAVSPQTGGSMRKFASIWNSSQVGNVEMRIDFA